MCLPFHQSDSANVENKNGISNRKTRIILLSVASPFKTKRYMSATIQIWIENAEKEKNALINSLLWRARIYFANKIYA